VLKNALNESVLGWDDGDETALDAVLRLDGKIVAVGFNARQTSTDVDFPLARYAGSSP
jgi:hypothetical protein